MMCSKMKYTPDQNVFLPDNVCLENFSIQYFSFAEFWCSVNGASLEDALVFYCVLSSEKRNTPVDTELTFPFYSNKNKQIGRI